MSKSSRILVFCIAFACATIIQVAFLVIYFRSKGFLDDTALLVYYPLITLIEKLLPGTIGENPYAQLSLLGCVVIAYSVVVGCFAMIIGAIFKSRE